MAQAIISGGTGSVNLVPGQQYNLSAVSDGYNKDDIYQYEGTAWGTTPITTLTPVAGTDYTLGITGTGQLAITFTGIDGTTVTGATAQRTGLESTTRYYYGTATNLTSTQLDATYNNLPFNTSATDTTPTVSIAVSIPTANYGVGTPTVTGMTDVTVTPEANNIYIITGTLTAASATMTAPIINTASDSFTVNLQDTNYARYTSIGGTTQDGYMPIANATINFN